MTQQQLEIVVPAHSLRPSARRRQLRANRARWWFDRMRTAVESAVEWTPPVRTRSREFETLAGV